MLGHNTSSNVFKPIVLSHYSIIYCFNKNVDKVLLWQRSHLFFSHIPPKIENKNGNVHQFVTQNIIFNLQYSYTEKKCYYIQSTCQWVFRTKF